MDNPLTGDELRPEAADYVTKIRTVRKAARKDARSGNPAVAAPARQVIDAAPRLIAATYRQEVGR